MDQVGAWANDDAGRELPRTRRERSHRLPHDERHDRTSTQALSDRGVEVLERWELLGVGRPTASDALQLIGEPVDDLGARQNIGQRPRERQGGRVVARDQDRDECVAHFVLVERRAVIVRRREQIVEHVFAGWLVFASPTRRDECKQVVVQVAEAAGTAGPSVKAAGSDRSG